MGLRSFLWSDVATVAALALAAFASLAPCRAAALDLAQTGDDEIKALEQRLTDAGCYKGGIDGKTSALLTDAIKACPDQRPFLRIETGMHTGTIWRIGVDAGCSLLATASDDKTVRLWSLPDGKLKRAIRLPDGQLLATGGWDPARHISVNIVNTSDWSIRRLGSFGENIHQLAFSPDGQRIAVGLANNSGVRVLDSSTGRELLADRDYGADVFGLAFAPDGALVATSMDGKLRRYDADLRLSVKRTAPDGKQPFGVAIDPSGGRAAIGYVDQQLVSILDATTLMPLAKVQKIEKTYGVAWSRDGATLAAGGEAREQFQGKLRSFLHQFDSAGRRKRPDVVATDDTINDIRQCGDGFVFGARDPAFGLLSAQGVSIVLSDRRVAGMSGKLGSAFTLSPDATSVRFGLGYGQDRPILFDLTAGAVTDSPYPPPHFTTAKTNGLPVTDWDDTFSVKFNGARLLPEKTEVTHALAIRPDMSGFAIGTAWYVRSYSAKGKERWEQPGPNVAEGVDFSGDGEILAVAYGDGTIRWLRWSDGSELLALFVEPQSRKWVAWTPSGYYMASAGGEDLIGWHVNRGWEQEADFFPASQFRTEYNRPDIVKLVLQTKDEDEAIRRANARTQREPAKPVVAALPPVVTITSPSDGSHFST